MHDDQIETEANPTLPFQEGAKKTILFGFRCKKKANAEDCTECTVANDLITESRLKTNEKIH